MWQPILGCRVADSVSGPRVIFEKRQDAEIRCQACQKNQPAATRPLDSPETDAYAEIDRSDEHQEKRVRRPPVHVKVITRRKNDEQAQSLRSTPDKDQHDREEDRVGE